jgi:NAD(P)-dependent dehydrogenase (short-subunit alcohol dehydrogenase family)
MAGVQDKVAIVTGAAGSLGAAQARMLARNGAKTVLTDLKADAGEALAAELAGEGCDVLFLAHDVTSEPAWQEVMAKTVERFGRLDVLVNNAGVNLKRGALEDRSVEEFDLMTDVNIKSVFLGTKHAIPLLRAVGGGSIVNISSVAGLGRSKIMEAIYVATKGAVFMFTKATAAQYGGDNIRANSVHPGPMMSEMLMGYYSTPELKAERLSLVPLNRFGEPDDIANAVMFLASDEANYISGTQIVVDGGSLAQ